MAPTEIQVKKKGPLILSHVDQEQLSEYLGRNIGDKTDLLIAARAVATLRLEGIDITLEPYLLNRLKSRCHSTEDFGEFVKRVVIEQLHAYAGC